MLLRLQQSWRIVVVSGILTSSTSIRSLSARRFVTTSTVNTAVVAAMTTPSSSSTVPSSSTRAPSSSAPLAAKRIAVGQLRSTQDKWRNLVHVAHCAGVAQRHGASLLCLPENLGFLGASVEETLRQADPPLPRIQGEDDPTEVESNALDDNVAHQNTKAVSQTLRDVVKQAAVLPSEPPSTTTDFFAPTNPSPSAPIVLLDGLRTIARQSGLWLTGTLHVGGAPPREIPPASSANDVSQSQLQPPPPPQPQSRVYNTHIVLDDLGRLRAKYEKIHLFDVDIPGQVSLQESATTAPGHTVVVCDSPVGRLGLSTCYDVRFPELYAALVRRGAQILLVPSAFTVPTGTAHWHTLLRARAIETQCYVVAAAQVGVHNAKRTSYGHSLAIDPWGTILTDAGRGGIIDHDNDHDGDHDGDEGVPPTVVCCDVDLSLVETVRQRMPVQTHRERAHFE